MNVDPTSGAYLRREDVLKVLEQGNLELLKQLEGESSPIMLDRPVDVHSTRGVLIVTPVAGGQYSSLCFLNTDLKPLISKGGRIDFIPDEMTTLAQEVVSKNIAQLSLVGTATGEPKPKEMQFEQGDDTAMARGDRATVIERNRLRKLHPGYTEQERVEVRNEIHRLKVKHLKLFHESINRLLDRLEDGRPTDEATIPPSTFAVEERGFHATEQMLRRGVSKDLKYDYIELGRRIQIAAKRVLTMEGLPRQGFFLLSAIERDAAIGAAIIHGQSSIISGPTGITQTLPGYEATYGKKPANLDEVLAHLENVWMLELPEGTNDTILSWDWKPLEKHNTAHDRPAFLRKIMD